MQIPVDTSLYIYTYIGNRVNQTLHMYLTTHILSIGDDWLNNLIYFYRSPFFCLQTLMELTTPVDSEITSLTPQ